MAPSSLIFPKLILVISYLRKPVDVALGNNPEMNNGEDGPSARVLQLTSELPTIRDEVKRRLAQIQSKQRRGTTAGGSRSTSP